MKKNLTIILLFFTIYNTSYFWMQLPFPWSIVFGLFIYSSFLFLLVWLIYQIAYFYIGKKENKRKRVTTIVLILLVFIQGYFFPSIYNFEKSIEGKNLFTAHYEGVANCMFLVKLKESQQFKTESFCFGSESKTGNYQIKNDTIHFYFDDYPTYEEKYTYGVLKENSSINKKKFSKLLYYKKKTDSIPLKMVITKNILLESFGK